MTPLLLNPLKEAQNSNQGLEYSLLWLEVLVTVHSNLHCSLALGKKHSTLTWLLATYFIY